MHISASYLSWILSSLTLFFFTYVILHVTNHLFLSLQSVDSLKNQFRSKYPREWPSVSIHLPFHNERRVASRIIQSCLDFDYPLDKLEIIVVDDSIDGTTEIAKSYEKKYPSIIQVLHRKIRRGFKAGSLNLALHHSKGEYIVIFDADYIPPKNFLKKTLPYIISNENCAFIQTRCSHLNHTYNILTRAAALVIDWFWKREQNARFNTDSFTHFGGTGAVFRRKALETVNGWPENTLAEDLDLSIRLQLEGWRYIYLPNIACPGEIPITLRTLLRQQFRWAKGFTQCLLKHTSKILKSNILSFRKKMETILLLSVYFTAPTLIGFIATLSISLMNVPIHFLKIVIAIILAEFTIPLIFFIALILKEKKGFQMNERLLNIERLKTWGYLILIIPLTLFIYSIGVFEALLGIGSPFHRTPKYGIHT